VEGPAAAPAAPAAPADPCPASVWQQGESQGGACLQPTVIGAQAVKACGARLEQAGWQPDPAAASLIGERMGQELLCWRAPASTP
jgi:hypothetical protein